MLCTSLRFFSQCLLPSDIKASYTADRKWCLDGPFVSDLKLLPTTMFSSKLPHLAVGLGLFFKKKDERHNCSTVIVPLWNRHNISTFCKFSSTSHHISENKSGK